jgi:hypothetical protein
MLEQCRTKEHVNQSLNVTQRTIASVPDDPGDALLRHTWRRMRPNRQQYFGQASQSDCGEPVVDVHAYDPSPSK